MRRGVHAGPQPPPCTPLPARALAQQLLLLPSSRCHPAGAGAGDPAAGPALVAAVAAAVWSAGTRVQSQAGGGGPGRLQSACLSLAPGWPCRSPQPGGSRCQGGLPQGIPTCIPGAHHMLHAGCGCISQGRGCIDPRVPPPHHGNTPSSPPPSLNPTDGQADITWGLQLDTPIAVTAPHCPQEQH